MKIGYCLKNTITVYASVVQSEISFPATGFLTPNQNQWSDFVARPSWQSI